MGLGHRNHECIIEPAEFHTGIFPGGRKHRYVQRVHARVGFVDFPKIPGTFKDKNCQISKAYQ